jgi:biotin carboxylase
MTSATSAPEASLVFVEANASGTGVRAVQRAHELGLNPVFCAEDPDLFLALPGGEAIRAATIIRCDTYSPDAVTTALLKADCQVDGVVALDDYHLVPAAVVAMNFGLRGPSVDGILSAKQKDIARRKLSAAGVRQPWFTVVAEWRPSEAETYPYPLVVKPIDDSGSVGVSLCESPAELAEAITTNLSRTTNTRGYRLSSRVLLEQYVRGPEYSAELLHHDDGQWQLLGYTDRMLGGARGMVECTASFPVDPQGAARSAAERETEIIGWLTALGLDTPAAHVEFKVTDHGDLIPIEINPRVVGGNVTRLIEAVSGFDPMDHVLLSSVGRAPARRPLHLDGTGTVHFPIPDREGTITGIELDTTRQLPDTVIDLSLVTALPREVRFPLSNYDWLGFILTKAENRDAAYAAALEAEKAIQVTWAAGSPTENRLELAATA